MLMGYGRLDANSFFFSIQVEMYLVARTWLKEQRIFTQNVFLVDAQTILEVIKVFGAISPAESVSERPCSMLTACFPALKGNGSNHFILKKPVELVCEIRVKATSE